MNKEKPSNDIKYPKYNDKVFKRWSSLGLHVDASDFRVFKTTEGSQNIIMIPQLEHMTINNNKVFQDYKPFYQRETLNQQLKIELRKN